MADLFVAKASMRIAAPLPKVWDALVNPQTIKKYMFGTNVISDWQKGGSIIWQGEWAGKHYADKGTILQLIPQTLLQYTHFSPLSGLPDEPQNYHTVTVELTAGKNNVLVMLTQDNNTSKAEQEHSEKNWNMMLVSLKKLLET